MVARFFFIATMVVAQQIAVIDGWSIGINYGMKGNNLPPAQSAINLIKSKGIQMVRLFEPNPEALNALSGTGINVALGTLDKDIQGIASNVQVAVDWLNRNVIPYKNTNIKWITVGNEVIPGDKAEFVLPAMQNLQKALEIAGLSGSIFITTVIPAITLATSYPPSTGVFQSNLTNIMTGITSFITQTGSPLMVNVYPYFAYAANPSQIRLDFALFNATTYSFIDQGLEYYNLFESMVDAFFAAVVKVGGHNDIKIIISESGWPSVGNYPFSSVENAKTYDNNLKSHIILSKGTPKRPNVPLDTFIFSLFNENLKTNEVEQNFGNFYPNMEPVYPLW